MWPLVFTVAVIVGFCWLGFTRPTVLATVVTVAAICGVVGLLVWGAIAAVALWLKVVFWFVAALVVGIVLFFVWVDLTYGRRNP